MTVTHADHLRQVHMSPSPTENVQLLQSSQPLPVPGCSRGASCNTIRLNATGDRRRGDWSCGSRGDACSRAYQKARRRGRQGRWRPRDHCSTSGTCDNDRSSRCDWRGESHRCPAAMLGARLTAASRGGNG